MDHFQVSLESKKWQRQAEPAKNSNPINQPSNQLSHEIHHTSTRSDAGHSGKEVPPCEEPGLAYIRSCLGKLSHHELFGDAHVLQYLNDQHRRRCRPNTIKNTYLDILLLFKYLKKTGRTCIESITRNDVSGFIEHEQDRGLKPTTISTRLRTLYAFLGYLAERDAISPDVLKRKMRIKVPDPLPRAIDPEDIRIFLSVIEKTRDRAMMLLLLRTGMRIGELLNTRIEDIHLDENRIDIVEAGKTRTGRVVYIGRDAEAVLRTWLNERDPQEPYLFYSSYHHRYRLGYTAARNIFVKYIKKSGLSHKGYSLHCLRHTFASELLNAGMRLECLQQLLGHSCIEMTRRYARLTDITRREEYFRAMDKIEKGTINGSYQCDS